MATPCTMALDPPGNVKFKWLLMVVAATSIVQHSTATDGNGTAGNISLAKPGCQYQCGSVSIPYPFGMGPDHCFLNKDFIVNCTTDNVAILNNSGTSLVLLDIDADNGLARVLSPIKWHCNYTNDTVWNSPMNNNSPWPFSVSPPFSVNSGLNKFTVIGCATVALANDGENENAPYSACGSFCYDSTGHINIDNINSNCSGVGCCQAAIPRNLYKFDLNFSVIDNSAVRNISPCSYGFIVDADIDAFRFHPTYLNSSNILEDYRDGVPLVLDWNLYNQTCAEAIVNKSSYACLAKNSSCIDYPIDGDKMYYCECDDGFYGNPYLDGGCQDINECDDVDSCAINATCINTIGSFYCSCPPRTNSTDPTSTPCTSIIPPIPAGSNKQPQVKLVIGTSIGCVVFIICIFALLIMCQKRQLAKEKERFYKQNGGHILYQQILSKQIDTMVIFTLEDLKKATNNYDRSRELGVGGHGTVYKGIMEDKKVVAAKRSKIMNVTHTEEFVQEIIILSQLNHRNVVRLLGCCVETEVPILVYEYIPNGTLFQLIHGDHSRPPVSLEDRLRIAQESAEALAYLHLSIHRPIVHGDVKSLNILLDDNYMAKVTDFGASRMLPKDAVQLMTMVQGTLGYLDPEYLQEQKLTEKSDVYSFGVVLLELITRKTAIYFEVQEEGKNLAASFLQALKHNRVQSMLDTSIMHAGTEELFQEVVELARRCLSLRGSERPSMTDVADKLKAIRSTWAGILLLKHEETHRQAEMSSTNSDCNNLSPSMYWTAGMLGVEAPPIDHHAGSTTMHAMGISLDDT